jgi:hypothetical protein
VISLKGKNSIITNYTHDAFGKVTTKKVVNVSDGRRVITLTNNYRDNSGRIIKTSEIVEVNSTVVDPINTYVYYANSSTTNWSHTITKIGLMGITTIDSTAYTYDNRGNVISSTSYTIAVFEAALAAIKSKSEFYYDASKSAIEKKSFEYTGGNLGQVSTYKYAYDTNINPLIMESESILLDIERGNSKNNISSIEKTDFKNALNSYLSTRNYKLNSKGVPSSCNEIFEKGGISLQSTYYYN